MTVQSTYTKFQRQAIAGMIAYDFGTADVTSHIAEADVTMGRFVVKGTGAGEVAHGNTTDAVLGVAARSLIGTDAVNTNASEYGATETVPVVREGYVFMENGSAATALVEGGDVYANATGELVASGDTGAVKVVGSRLESAAAVGAIALVRVQINLT